VARADEGVQMHHQRWNTKQTCSVCGLNIVPSNALCIKNALEHTVYRGKNSQIFWVGLIPSPNSKSLNAPNSKLHHAYKCTPPAAKILSTPMEKDNYKHMICSYVPKMLCDCLVVHLHDKNM